MTSVMEFMCRHLLGHNIISWDLGVAPLGRDLQLLTKMLKKKIKYLQGPSQNSYNHHKGDIFVLEVSPRAATSEMLSVPENGRSNKSVTTNPADLIDLFGPNLTAYYNYIMRITIAHYRNSVKTCPSLLFYFMKNSFYGSSRKWILPNMIRAGTDCTQMVLVNSHQRWKQTLICVCFHLWCELTPALWCHSIVWSLFSWNKM